MCPLTRNLQEWHRVGESSYQEEQQAWKCSSEPWPAGLFRNRPREGPQPACTRNSASCMGPRPRSMQNTIEDSARVSQSVVPTPIPRMNGLMKNGSILMKISLATRDTTTDPLPLFSAWMGRQFLDIEAEHLDIKAIQKRTSWEPNTGEPNTSSYNSNDDAAPNDWVDQSWQSNALRTQPSTRTNQSDS